MPGTRIKDLTALSGAGSANNDDLLIFDADADATKRISRSQLAEGMAVDLGLNGLTASVAELNILDGVTATTAELNILDGVTATTAELNILDGVTSTTAELNILDGVTASTAELNILAGVTSSTAELNILDGVTASTAELNILDGVTATTAELNILDGVTATASELNYVDGKTLSGSDTEIITGTAGSDGQVAQWNADGDVVGYTLPTQVQATWEAGTDTTESLVSPAKVKAAIDALATTTIADGSITEAKLDSSAVSRVKMKTGTNSGSYSTGSGGGSGTISMDAYSFFPAHNGSATVSIGGTSADAPAINWLAGGTTSGTVYWRYVQA